MTKTLIPSCRCTPRRITFSLSCDLNLTDLASPKVQILSQVRSSAARAILIVEQPLMDATAVEHMWTIFVVGSANIVIGVQWLQTNGTVSHRCGLWALLIVVTTVTAAASNGSTNIVIVALLWLKFLGVQGMRDMCNSLHGRSGCLTRDLMYGCHGSDQDSLYKQQTEALFRCQRRPLPFLQWNRWFGSTIPGTCCGPSSSARVGNV